jgi:hypothetical protein
MGMSNALPHFEASSRFAWRRDPVLTRMPDEREGASPGQEVNPTITRLDESRDRARFTSAATKAGRRHQAIPASENGGSTVEISQ